MRVSTGEQSVSLQQDDLRRYAGQRGFTIVEEYIDQGISGTKDRRPALDALMNAARKRKFDAVLVWRFDRWARSTKHLIQSLSEFRALGIDFLSYQENLDTSSPLGEAIFTIIAAIGQLERDVIVQRVRAGLATARERGTRTGKPIGRPKSRNDTKIADMRAQGMSIRAIARALNVSTTTVQRGLAVTKPIPVVVRNPE